MTDTDTPTPRPSFPPMHPVTRLGRVIQQLRSFGDLHANELEAMAQQLDGAGPADIAAQLRAYRDVQRDEAQMVVDELVDIQTDMSAAAAAAAQATQMGPELPAVPASPGVPHDPAADSPRRARWLAEQAAEEERRRQPVSRRELFGRVKADPDTP